MPGKKFKREIVTALQYSPKENNAPTVLAKGKGLVAQKIKEVAKEHNVPIYKDENLAKQLDNLSIGQEIPPELYRVIAEILSFIIRLDAEGERHGE